VIAPGLFLPCIQKSQRRKIIRWPNAGKRTPRESLSLYVTKLPPTLPRTHLKADWTGLFSAVVAAFVVVSVQDLRPNSQDISAFYLENIYQLLADPDLPRPTNPSTMAKPPPFSPPVHAVWVNTLWFLSLVIGLTCAMLATSLQQWTRRHIRITQPARRRPHKRARARAYFANGIDKFHFPSAVEALPALVHLSLFTFFTSLLVYLFNINHTVFGAVICWVVLLSATYACITLMPIFWHDSPYYAPLSSTAWTLYAAISYTLFHALPFISDRRHHYASCRHFCEWRDYYYDHIFVSMERVAEEAALKRSSELDVRVLEWTLDALDEDDALERFLAFVPGFYKSDVVKTQDFPRWPHEDLLRKIRCTLRYFLSRSFSSNSVSELVTVRRLALCLDAANAVNAGWVILEHIINFSSRRRVPHFVEIGLFLRSWVESSDVWTASYVQVVIAHIIARVQEHDDRWIALAMDYLGVPEGVPRDYLAHGDSLLLANLIRTIRPARSYWCLAEHLSALCEFDVHNTLPGLRREFCTLWNEMSRQAQNNPRTLDSPKGVLLCIWPIYNALHPNNNTNSNPFIATSVSWEFCVRYRLPYPLCNNPNHHTDMTQHAHEVAVRATTHPSATISITFSQRGLVLATVSSLQASHPNDTAVHRTDEPSLGDPTAPITQSSYHTQVPPSEPTTPFVSAATTSARAAVDYPALSLTGTSDPHSIPAASTSISQSAVASSSYSHISTQHSPDYLALSPSMVHRMSPSFSPPLFPNNTLAMVLRPSPKTSGSQSD